jgi:hypothetical protein
VSTLSQESEGTTSEDRERWIRMEPAQPHPSPLAQLAPGALLMRFTRYLFAGLLGGGVGGGGAVLLMRLGGMGWGPALFIGAALLLGSLVVALAHYVEELNDRERKLPQKREPAASKKLAVEDRGRAALRRPDVIGLLVAHALLGLALILWKPSLPLALLGYLTSIGILTFIRRRGFPPSRS